MRSTKLIHAKKSSDGHTVKMLIELVDGYQIESVIMFYDTRLKWDKAAPPPDDDNDDNNGNNDSDDNDFKSNHSCIQREQGRLRATLCVSSEVGCQMGCTFCATGTMGLKADLTTGEIVEQLVHALQYAPVRNVVFMGMGEPLNNYQAVVHAVQLMTSNKVFSLRRSAVTVSTVGVVPRIKQMATDLPGVSLALSLHAPTQDLRQTIVPSAKAYKLDKLMAALDEYQEKTGQKVFVEYVMLGPDVNCTVQHARQLGEMLTGKNVTINLIPWNPILSPGMPFTEPRGGGIGEFARILKEEYALATTVRQEKGQDVEAACGQLVVLYNEGGGGSVGKRVDGTSNGIKDLEDLVACM
jgi:adenine C2-methylase RlmN of 23S rRNA A2503 and tRNA A37